MAAAGYYLVQGVGLDAIRKERTFDLSDVIGTLVLTAAHSIPGEVPGI